jgi:uncharacterized protein with HEPN domain
MKRLNSDWLEDILDTIDEIDRVLAPKSQHDLETDVVLKAAVSHFIMIISEASRKIPDNYKNEFPLIEWRKIVDIGNRIRHGYFNIRHQILWEIYQHELPALRHTILQLLKKEGIGRL